MTAYRCTGHCCRRFALPHGYDELQAMAGAEDASSDTRMIAAMVIPVASSKDGREHLYRCKNLGVKGDCAIYDRRPQMCRDFPEAKGCHFWKCTSSESAYFGLSLPRKIWTRWRWLRGLAQPDQRPSNQTS
ncbi:MAG: YkgJ family cysteine cluster protein [Bdellovibrionota bacterium]